MKTTSACLAVLRRLRGIRRSVPRTVFQSLVSCLVLPQLDYYNAVLADIPLHLARRLQSVMNAAARLVFSSSKCDHITPLLRQLHWLKVPWRIDYKLAVLVYKCLHGLTPSYLADELHHPAESEFRRRLRSASSHEMSPYPTLNLLRPSFSSRRCTDLEQSSAAYHICSVTSRLLLSLEAG